ncbi:potassium-transporting ATPase subunit KdpC [Luteibacter pinisoli]|uniref:Potassium-transporting ATPase KdpC subunit n=1 Tax=Luteibacter pinisoli TaxID=2589080 RepID=A0A4Y5Z8V5_9GAMM|nr:potassium-transporting ATPase subunit KdpC [Luteibacter pinisoli]QDE41396.1 potassium-transporting ATPase subunit KdpC [Luteibacter pinisoli]
MVTLLRNALVLLLLLTAVTGVAYPVVVGGLGHLMFAHEAGGSLIERDGKVVGSSLIGQSFTAPGYFWGRPSATTPDPYNAGASTGSNQGPTNPALADAAKQRIAALRAVDPTNTAPVPVELVTASASGLDPEISPAAAEYQANRVAKARHMDPAKVRELVAANTKGRQLGLLGEPRVNVLQLNLALDQVAR